MSAQPEGELTLLEACATGSFSAAERLLRHGADVNVNAVRKPDGSTALAEVAKRSFHRLDCQEVVELLLEHGAQPNVLTKAGKTALMLACEQRAVEVARMLLDHHADVNLCKPTGTTALMCACKRKDVVLASLLLDRGANVDLAAKRGTTALMAAARSGDLRFARLLIDRGANLDIQSEDGSTALLIACAWKKTSVAELLIEKGANLNLQDKTGCTPLMLASERRPVPTAKLLVNRGADMNLQDDTGSTALMRACKSGSIMIAIFLIKQGANPDICDRNGKTALMYECGKPRALPRVVKHLLTRGAKIAVEKKSAFFEACSADHMEIVELLLEHGAEINAQDEEGKTGLMLACSTMYGRISLRGIVKFLLERGADANVRSRTGLTALMLAGEGGNESCVEALLDQHGVAINQQSDDGSTALMHACRSWAPFKYATRALLARGADINIQRQDGSTALMLASLRNVHERLIVPLLEAGAKPNLQRRDGVTALMIQCVQHGEGNSYIPQVELMMRHGADLGLRDSFGWSALELACVNHLRMDIHGRFLLQPTDLHRLGPEFAAKMELALLLVNAGAPLDFSHVPSVKAQKALTVACRNGFPEVIQVELLSRSRRFPSQEPPRENRSSAFRATAAKRRRLAR